ncbi:hypothetical protein A0257_05775 [Hymenobacter psoromatis]|nr:hypothetical protein A0257_05775 [Hymenobacter psoromatis]
MIFYGTNGKHYATHALPATSCPACRAPNLLQVSLISRYAHVYWIPLFPYQKIAVTQCLNCQTAWTEKELTPALTPAVRAVKKQSYAPYWNWAGLLLIAALSLWGYLHGIRDRRTDEALLASPRAGDIYTVRSDSSHLYSLLKVKQVGGNVVELLPNEYETEDATPINSLNAPARYGKNSFTLTFLDLQIMRRKGQLTDVDRLEE